MIRSTRLRRFSRLVCLMTLGLIALGSCGCSERLRSEMLDVGVNFAGDAVSGILDNFMPWIILPSAPTT